MTDYKVASTPDIERLNTNARKAQLNQTLGKAFLDTLDIEGTHVVQFHSAHEKAGTGPGSGSPTHIRAIWLFKIAGTDEPVEKTFDLTMKDFLALPQASTT